MSSAFGPLPSFDDPGAGACWGGTTTATVGAAVALGAADVGATLAVGAGLAVGVGSTVGGAVGATVGRGVGTGVVAAAMTMTVPDIDAPWMPQT